jgi:Tfp pilus assembly pilus retraction ATPase PilT
MRASDVHIQPYEEKLQVRFRIDGILYDMMTPPKKIQEAIISRVKIMGKMDIAERRLPQDGRATVKLGDSEVDIRISSVPTNHGERLVLRLLDKGARLYELEELGLEVEDREIVKRLIDASHGIVLVTGPTGSGKTTSLYAALKRINATEYNIMTIEDPIEYHLPGISQIEVNYKKGLTFATACAPSSGRTGHHLVGEIRDEDTAGIAIRRRSRTPRLSTLQERLWRGDAADRYRRRAVPVASSVVGSSPSGCAPDLQALQGRGGCHGGRAETDRARPRKSRCGSKGARLLFADSIPDRTAIYETSP